MKSWLARLPGKEQLRRAGEDPSAIPSPGPVWSDPEIPDEERAVALVRLLEDPTAREDEQGDAASALELLSGPFVEAALIRAIRAGDFHSDLSQSCAESLAGIWAREGHVDPAFLAELHSLAKEEVFGILGARASHLLPLARRGHTLRVTVRAGGPGRISLAGLVCRVAGRADAPGSSSGCWCTMAARASGKFSGRRTSARCWTRSPAAWRACRAGKGQLHPSRRCRDA